jgi:hypothetical protein
MAHTSSASSWGAGSIESVRACENYGAVFVYTVLTLTGRDHFGYLCIELEE